MGSRSKVIQVGGRLKFERLKFERSKLMKGS